VLDPPKRRDLDRPVRISLEAAVPRNHFYRHLHRLRDLSFVRDLAADRYATLGETEPPPLAAINDARWNLLGECRLDPERSASDGYERKSDRQVSATDADAALMKPLGERTCLGYLDHYVIDDGKARVILEAETGDRGHDPRDGGQYPGGGGERRPRVCPLARLGPAHPVLRPILVHIRRGAGPLPPSAGRDAAPPEGRSPCPQHRPLSSRRG
jgi:hypothetical protein